MKRMARIVRFPWYPTLIILAFLLRCVVTAGVGVEPALRPIVIALVLGPCVTLVGIRLAGSERGPFVAAAAIAALIVIRDFSTLLPFLALIPVLILERRQAHRNRPVIPWRRVNESATVFMGALAVVVSLTMLAPAMTGAAEAAVAAGWEVPPSVVSPPDVFVIIADSHGREDVLRDLYGYDSRAFSDSLRTLGFDVSSHARSNYFLTRYSLASFLSGTHLWELGQRIEAPASDEAARLAVSGNRAFWLLDNLGYETVVVSSGWEHLGLRSANRFVDTGQPGELELSILRDSLPGRLLLAVAPDFLRTLPRQRTLDELGTLESLAAESAVHPQFVLVHLPLPHLPFVVTADCAFRPAADEAVRPLVFRTGTPETAAEAADDFRTGTPETAAQAADQNRCVDRLLLEPLKAVIDARPNAVVIVMSDHGPFEHLDWFTPNRAGLDERSAILFAARTPGREDVFPEDITLVNVLPRLFNAYFGTEILLHADDVYFGPAPITGRFDLVSEP
jgi:hypothetical protein